MIQLLSYTKTLNIGDAIQTVALSRLIKDEITYVDRASCDFNPQYKAVVNGWLGRNSAPRNPNVLFAGIYLAGNIANIPFIESSYFPIGARDRYTVELLNHFGVESQFVGCATLTLPKYDGPRSGECIVDSTDRTPHIYHEIPSETTWERQLEMANKLLEMYKTAELVVTSRLHVALPCLAMGTPVLIQTPRLQQSRFSILKELGVPLNKIVTQDVTEIAEKYKKFLIDSHVPINSI